MKDSRKANSLLIHYDFHSSIANQTHLKHKQEGADNNGNTNSHRKRWSCLETSRSGSGGCSLSSWVACFGCCLYRGGCYAIAYATSFHSCLSVIFTASTKHGATVERILCVPGTTIPIGVCPTRFIITAAGTATAARATNILCSQAIHTVTVKVAKCVATERGVIKITAVTTTVCPIFRKVDAPSPTVSIRWSRSWRWFRSRFWCTSVTFQKKIVSLVRLNQSKAVIDISSGATKIICGLLQCVPNFGVVFFRKVTPH